jgi:hypothetical protein
MSDTPAQASSEDTQPGEQTESLKGPAQPESQGEEDARRPRRARRSTIGSLLLWLMVTLSLLLNLVMLRQVILARDLARQAVGDAAAVLENLQSQSFVYTFVIDDTLPVKTDVPLNATIPVTIRQNIPVDVMVTVPVETVFGPIDLDVPIQTNIPVNLQQDIVIDQVFTIDTAVPVYIEVPIDLKVRDTPLSELLESIKLRLEAMERSLSEPLIPFTAR